MKAIKKKIYKKDRINLVIFLDGHRPKDNLSGLLMIAQNSNSVNALVLKSIFQSPININKISTYDLNNLDSICEKNNFSLKNLIKNFNKLLTSDLVFGSFDLFARIFSLALGWKGYYICVPPGKITKALGYFKDRSISILKIVNNIISHKFLRTFILASDEIDMLYLSSGHSYLASSLLISPLPKHIWMCKHLEQENVKNKILFAPTERSKGNRTPIYSLLCSEKITTQIKEIGYEISYSHHIHDENQPSNLSLAVEEFDGDWSSVAVLVTDYSSIGADFLISGGREVIYYTEDDAIFQKSQGYGPIFKIEVSKAYEAKTISDLIFLLKKIDSTNEKNRHSSINTTDSLYFHKIYSMAFNSNI